MVDIKYLQLSYGSMCMTEFTYSQADCIVNSWSAIVIPASGAGVVKGCLSLIR